MSDLVKESGGLVNGEVKDLISRQAAIDYLMDNMAWYSEDGYETDDEEKRKCITSLINAIPSVTQKTGRWIEEDTTYCGASLSNYKCDKCGETGGTWRYGLKPDKLPKYCMNCGAKMQEE